MTLVLGQILTAVVTPFAEDGSVNLDSFKRLCLHLVENGSDGVVVAGTTGEAPTLSDEERLGLFAAAIEAVGDRANVVAGTGTYSTAHSVHLTREAHKLGVDAFLVVTPYYNKPPVRGIVAHFEAIATVTDKPIVVYNIPQRVVINLEPDTLAELAEIPNVQYVKQTTTRPVASCPKADSSSWQAGTSFSFPSWSWGQRAESSSTRILSAPVFESS